MKTFVLGICGGSASGKSYLVKDLIDALRPVPVSVVNQDSFYKDLSHLSVVERELSNFDHPEAVDIDLFCLCLTTLKAGFCTTMPVYDYVTHTRVLPEKNVSATRLIIAEGLHILFHESIRSLIDYCVFIDVEQDIRFIRRLERDMRERGRTVDSIIKQYLTTVRPMEVQYIQPSIKYADCVITETEYAEKMTEIKQLLISSLVDN